MAMDRTVHDTPEKVLVYGLRRVGQIQQQMLSECDEKTKGLLREILRLEVIEISRDKRIIVLSNRLYNMGFKATNNKSPKKASDDELRVQIKRLTNQLSFHKGQSAGRKLYINAMRKAGFGKGPLVSKDHPRGDRTCHKCGEYREHYKNCAYCTVCWKDYAPKKAAQKRYENKYTRLNGKNGNHRQRVLKSSGVKLEAETLSGLKLIRETDEQTS